MNASNYKHWECQCGHEVHSKDRPEPIRWSDGHVCYFTKQVIDLVAILKDRLPEGGDHDQARR